MLTLRRYEGRGLTNIGWLDSRDSISFGGYRDRQDSTGADGFIRSGETEGMSAGTDIERSEMNASATQPVHSHQIWVHPSQRCIAPGYEQIAMPQVDLHAEPNGGPGAVTLHFDARVYRAGHDHGASIDFPTATLRRARVEVARAAAIAMACMGLAYLEGLRR